MESQTLRDETSYYSRLEKDNFDLKMKVYYLENSLKQRTDIDNLNTQTSLAVTNNELSRLLDEKKFELDLQNQILLQAKAAIESLKSELERLRTDSQSRSDVLNSQLSDSRRGHDELNVRYHELGIALETERSTCKQLKSSIEQIKV